MPWRVALAALHVCACTPSAEPTDDQSRRVERVGTWFDDVTVSPTVDVDIRWRNTAWTPEIGVGPAAAGWYFEVSRVVRLDADLEGLMVDQVLFHELCHALDFQHGLDALRDLEWPPDLPKRRARGGMRNGRLAREHLATLCETGPHGLDLTRQAAVELSGLAVSVETIDALRKTAFDAPVAEPVLTDEVARFSLPYRVRGLSADVAPDGGLILEGLDSDSKLVSWRVARDGSIREGVVEGIPFSTYAVQGRDSGYWRVLEEYSRADDGAAVVWATRVVQESDQVVGFILMEEGQPPRPFEHTFRITGRHLADGTLEPPRPDEPAPFDDMVAAWQGDTAHIVLVTGTEGVWLTAMP